MRLDYSVINYPALFFSLEEVLKQRIACSVDAPVFAVLNEPEQWLRSGAIFAPGAFLGVFTVVACAVDHVKVPRLDTEVLKPSLTTNICQ
ncbi:Uncharacterized protein HZ326_14128 [Fusarium oxysporum f. sp. albedinis]|nr:Uncharacterized protein HZ326_14128 [Fusarium oxysporum f. sp. albedinis]